MSDLKICSVNCRGIGEYRKRKDVFNYLRKLDYNIFLLQDVHCSQEKVSSFRNMWGTDIIVAPHTHNSRGVAILTKNVDVNFESAISDENGNYIIVKASINRCFEIVIANVYGPNTDSPAFFETIEDLCLERAGENTPVLIAGDLNIALNSQLDTHNYMRENNIRAKNQIVQVMNDNSMIDVFREMHGSTKRYTWRVRLSTITTTCIKASQARLFLSV